MAEPKHHASPGELYCNKIIEIVNQRLSRASTVERLALNAFNPLKKPTLQDAQNKGFAPDAKQLESIRSELTKYIDYLYHKNERFKALPREQAAQTIASGSILVVKEWVEKQQADYPKADLGKWTKYLGTAQEFLMKPDVVKQLVPVHDECTKIVAAKAAQSQSAANISIAPPLATPQLSNPIRVIRP